MTDAEYKATRARIVKAVDAWSESLGLGWWRITYDYYREGLPDSVSEPGYSTLGRVTALWQYQTANVSFNVLGMATLSDEELERVVVHEMMHILLRETREDGDDCLNHEERVASTLTSAFIWTRAVASRDKGKERRNVIRTRAGK